MTPPALAPLSIERDRRDVAWRVLEGGAVIGSSTALSRPDRRCFVSIDTWRTEVFGLLLQTMSNEFEEDLFTTVDEADGARLEQWSAGGFTVNRLEHEYLIPTAPEATGLRGAATPPGIDVVSAAQVDVAGLRRLDEELRTDVPGSDGWINDPQEFREYTFDPRHFDPATYLVAVDQASGDLLGLARVWTDRRFPRLGLIGVVAGHRRRGLARALIGAALLPLHQRGVQEVAAEADARNAASITLLTSLGARRTGGSVELLRRWPS